MPKIDWVRLSSPHILAEVWVSSDSRFVACQVHDGSIVKGWVVMDSSEGELLEPTFGNIYEFREHVDSNYYKEESP